MPLMTLRPPGTATLSRQQARTGLGLVVSVSLAGGEVWSGGGLARRVPGVQLLHRCPQVAACAPLAPLAPQHLPQQTGCGVLAAAACVWACWVHCPHPPLQQLGAPQLPPPLVLRSHPVLLPALCC